MCARGVLSTKDPYEHFSRALNIFFWTVQKAFCVRGGVCAAYIVRVIVYCCAYTHVHINAANRSRGVQLTGINGQKEIAVYRCRGLLRVRMFTPYSRFPHTGHQFQMFWHKDFGELIIIYQNSLIPL